MKYLLCPGHITSKNDGYRHYISTRDLVKLYQVNPRDCFRNLNNFVGDYKILSPRYDGDYTIPVTIHTKES